MYEIELYNDTFKATKIGEALPQTWNCKFVSLTTLSVGGDFLIYACRIGGSSGKLCSVYSANKATWSSLPPLKNYNSDG